MKRFLEGSVLDMVIVILATIVVIVLAKKLFSVSF
jgi:hypothetical protein